MNFKRESFSKKYYHDYPAVILGTFIMAAGFVFFIDPYGIVPGGVYGIGILVNNMTQGMFPEGIMGMFKDTFIQYKGGIPIGFTGLLINVPLTLLGIKILGPRFGIKTVLGFILCTFFIDTLTTWWGLEPLVDNILLSCIFGAVFIGFGLGLVFRAMATTAGSDIIAMIMAKYTKLPLGQLIIIVDCIIVLCSLIVQPNWEIPLYSFLVIYLTGKVIDMTIYGSSNEKALFIISKEESKIREKILNDLERGGTILKGEGLFDRKEKNVIFTIVNRREIAILREFIYTIDPSAFISVLEVNETLGNGFSSLKESVDSEV